MEIPKEGLIFFSVLDHSEPLAMIETLENTTKTFREAQPILKQRE